MCLLADGETLHAETDRLQIFKSDTGFEPYQACCGHDKLAQRISTLQLQAAQDSVPSMERGIDDAVSDVSRLRPQPAVAVTALFLTVQLRSVAYNTWNSLSQSK